MGKGLIIAVDFDGTIVDHEYPKIGKEKELAISAMNALQKLGYKIIIWTCREDKELKLAIEWLGRRGFMPDAVNENIEKDLLFAKHKIIADLYFDDRSFPPFSGWKDIATYFRLGVI